MIPNVELHRQIALTSTLPCHSKWKQIIVITTVPIIKGQELLLISLSSPCVSVSHSCVFAVEPSN
jgi:hypothetical protein